MLRHTVIQSEPWGMSMSRDPKSRSPPAQSFLMKKGCGSQCGAAAAVPSMLNSMAAADPAIRKAKRICSFLTDKGSLRVLDLLPVVEPTRATQKIPAKVFLGQPVPLDASDVHPAGGRDGRSVWLRGLDQPARTGESFLGVLAGHSPRQERPDGGRVLAG